MSARMDEFRRRVWKESIRQAKREQQDRAARAALTTDWPFRLTKDDRQFLRVRRIQADDVEGAF